MNQCPRCTAYYKDGRPKNFGSEPKCAFPNSVFSTDNWQCRTANDIRDLIDQYQEERPAVYSDDQWANILPLRNGKFLVVGWYKGRGRTETMWVLSETTIVPATLKDAEEALSYHKETNRG